MLEELDTIGRSLPVRLVLVLTFLIFATMLHRPTVVIASPVSPSAA